MNTKLVETLAQIIKSLPEDDQRQLELVLRFERDSEHQELPFYQTATTEEWLKEFQAWIDSHQGRKFPLLSDQDISRESIYGERG